MRNSHIHSKLFNLPQLPKTKGRKNLGSNKKNSDHSERYISINISMIKIVPNLTIHTINTIYKANWGREGLEIIKRYLPKNSGSVILL